MKPVGLAFNGPPYTAEVMVDVAAAAERAEFDGIWFAEDPLGPDAFSMLAAFARATSRIRVGSCLVNISTRHPLVLGLSFATLDMLSHGRAIAGIGIGLSWLQYLGLSRDDIHPVADMTRAMELMRKLWADEEVLFGGQPAHYWGRRSSLVNAFNWPWGGSHIERGRIPIYIGARGPEMIRMAARTADGLILEHSAPPTVVAQAATAFRTELQAAGRGMADAEVVGMVMLSVSPSRTLDPSLLVYTAGLLARITTDSAAENLGLDPGLVARIRRLWVEGEEVKAARQVDESVVRNLIIVGDIDDCLERLETYHASGLDVPLLLPEACDLALALEVGRRYALGG